MPIRESLLKSIPFSCIQSRNAASEILSFIDYKEEVILLLQTLSHKTRAFIYNAHGLQGFLVSLDVMGILRFAQKQELLEKVTKWQVVDL